MICKACNTDVPKIQGRYKGHPIYRDDKGRNWGFGKCPDCYAKAPRISHSPSNPCVFCKNQTNTTDDICKYCYEQIEAEEAKTSKNKTRHCRRCEIKLNADRYFYCTDCLDFSKHSEEGMENDKSNRHFKSSKQVQWKDAFIEKAYAKYSKV
jgi:hypothetical protein